MFQMFLEGTRYSVRFEIDQTSREHSHRSDYDMSDGTSYSYYWSGWVAVSRSDGICVAVCKIDERCDRREYSETALKKQIINPDVLPGKEQEYADEVAERVIKAWKASRGTVFPTWKISSPDKDNLILKGILIDLHDQISIGLR